jgi:hypothetical protein
MTKLSKKVGMPLVWMSLLLMTVASVASASDLGPQKRQGRRHRPPVSVAEPAAIALLGAGLVSLGIYAKKKRGKKQ